MPSCLDTYRAAAEAAHQMFETALGTCGTIACKRAAVDAYKAAIDTAYAEFLECQGTPGGPVTTHFTRFANAWSVYDDSPMEQDDVNTFATSADALLKELVGA